MRHRLRLGWLRVQQTPLQIAVAFLGAVQAALLLAQHGGSLGPWTLAAVAMFLTGGLLVTAARLADHLHAESVGDALMIGGLAFITLTDLQYTHDVYDAAAVLATNGALTVGFAVRLHLVRATLHTVRRDGGV